MFIRSLSVGALLAVVTSLSTAGETLQLAVFEYPPFLAEGEKGYGVEPAIVKAAFQQMNIAVNFSFLPPARALKMAGAGEYDATLGWVRSDERERDFYFSAPIAEAPLVFFHLRKLPVQWKTFDDLKDMTIGTVVKYHYGAAFHEAQSAGKIKTDEAFSDELNFKKLLAERIQLTPVNLFVGYHLIAKTFDADTARLLTHNPVPLKISVHHVLFPKAKPESQSRLELFNRGLKKIRESGELQRILKEHLDNQVPRADNKLPGK